MWVKEFPSTVDSLEARKDIQADKFAYLGWSWGGFIGGIVPAVEKRIRVVVLNVGGMEMEKALPEVDQINYLPRITQPVLMLNGTYDMYFPVESSQKPMFRLLGTPKLRRRCSSTRQDTWSLPPSSSRKLWRGLIRTWGPPSECSCLIETSARDGIEHRTAATRILCSIAASRLSRFAGALSSRFQSSIGGCRHRCASTVVSKGTARFSSIIVSQPVVCSESP